MKHALVSVYGLDSGSALATGVFKLNAFSATDAIGIGTSTNHALVFGVNNAECARLTATLMTLTGVSVRLGATQSIYGSALTGNRGQIELYNGGTGNMTFYSTFSTADQIFIVGNNSDSAGMEAMRIAHGGSVGIGTSSPNSKLEVAGVITSGTGGGTFYLSRNLTDFSTRRNWGISTEVNTVGDFALLESTANNTSPSVARITVLSGGNVGIGTSTPSDLLDVNGTSTFRSYQTLYNATTVSGYFGCANGMFTGGSGSSLGIRSADEIWFGNSLSPTVKILNGGLLLTVASATGGAGLRIPHGTAPTSPVNGDFWTTTSGVFARLNGSTVQLSTAGGAITGSGTGSYVPKWSTSTVLTDSLLYDSGSGIGIGTTTVPAYLTVVQPVSTSGTPMAFKVKGGAHTTMAASTEAIDIYYDLNRTAQFSTGAITSQRAFVVTAPTYGFVGASTITTASTVAIAGAPSKGTNATITTSTALWIQNTACNATNVYGGLIQPSGNTSGSVFGFNIESDSQYSGTTGFVYGLRTRITNQSGNTITEGVGLYCRSPNLLGSCTTMYGIVIGTMKGSGVTTAYGLYQNGTQDFNLLTGPTFIGPTQTNATAYLHLDAGTTAANSAPLKFTAGTNMTTPESGSVEYDGYLWWLTGGYLTRTSISRTGYTGSTTANVNNTTTATSIVPTGNGTMTVKANTAQAGTTCRITMRGYYGTTSTPTFDIIVKLGSTTIGTINCVPAGNAGSHVWEASMDFTYHAVGASAATYFGGAWRSLTTSSIDGFGRSSATSTVTSDSTADKLLDVLIQWSAASGSNTITVGVFTVEWLN